MASPEKRRLPLGDEMYTNMGAGPGQVNVGTLNRSWQGALEGPITVDEVPDLSALYVKRPATLADITDLKKIYQAVPLPVIAGYVDTQFDKVNNTLANVPGLAVSLHAGSKYRFSVDLFCTLSAVGGIKFAIAGDVTPTALLYRYEFFNDGAGSLVATARNNALAVGFAYTGPTVAHVRIGGTIDVDADGDLAVQFAQDVANGTSSVLVGSFMTASRIG